MAWPPRKPPPKGPNQGHWRAGRKFPWWKDENRVWNKRRRYTRGRKPLLRQGSHGASFVRRAKKPWEDRIWIPYNNSTPGNDPARPYGSVCHFPNAGTLVRVVSFIPSIQALDASGTTSFPEQATDREFRVLGIQGDITAHVDMQAPYSSSGVPPYGIVWWQWMKERITPAAELVTTTTVSFRAQMLMPCSVGFTATPATAAQRDPAMRSHYVYDHGRVYFNVPPIPDDRSGMNYPDTVGFPGIFAKIPLPRLPRGGLKLRTGDCLSLLCSMSWPSGNGWSLENFALAETSLGWKGCISPYLRFLVTAL